MTDCKLCHMTYHVHLAVVDVEVRDCPADLPHAVSGIGSLLLVMAIQARHVEDVAVILERAQTDVGTELTELETKLQPPNSAIRNRSEVGIVWTRCLMTLFVSCIINASVSTTVTMTSLINYFLPISIFVLNLF